MVNRRIAGTTPRPTSRAEEDARAKEERELAKRVAKEVTHKVKKSLAVADAIPKRRKPRQNAHTDSLRAEAAERANQALYLRRNGASYIEIGRHLGTTAQTAGRLVERAIAEIPRENAEQYRTRQLLALEARELEAHQLIAQLKTRLREIDSVITTGKRREAVAAHRAAVACHTAIRGYHDLLTRIGEAQARLTGANAPIQHHVAVVPPNAAAIRDMSDDDLRKIASGDFSPITRGGALAVDGARAQGDDPARDHEGDREGPN